uniref:Uncharacterized protein n=1 Tax=Lactuca sativa TaxID=4236 RepID=A0A9R1UQB7_LACSA|nr:hypothetical protein LSAT_V11C800453100 [Lactuca sativa]
MFDYCRYRGCKALNLSCSDCCDYTTRNLNSRVVELKLLELHILLQIAAASSNLALKQPTIRVVAIIAEGVPESDTKELIIYARANNKVVIGPATVGGIQAGAFKIGDTAGTIDNIIQCKLYRPGSVGFVSKSVHYELRGYKISVGMAEKSAPRVLLLMSTAEVEKDEPQMMAKTKLVRTRYNFYQSTSTKLARENYFLHLGQSLFVIYTRWTTTNFLTWRICFLHDI